MNGQGIIIPVYEPDERFIELLKELDRKDMGPVFIVNDGSGNEYDATFEKAKSLVGRLGGKVLYHDINRGKGRALKTAFEYILDKRPDITSVVTADSDGQHTPECIQKVAVGIKDNPDSLVLGVRVFNTDGIPWKSKAGNIITEKVFHYLTGVHVSDTQTGLRGIPGSYLKELLNLEGERFEFEMRMLVDAADKMNIVEIPIKTVYESVDNHVTHFDPLMDSIKIYRILGGRLFKFIISSLSSCLLDLLLFAIFCRLFKNAYPIIYVTISTIFARLISATCNYLINYLVVFRSEENVIAAAVKYALLALFQMMFSAGLVTLFVFILHGSAEVIIKVAVDTVLFFISYKIQQKLVFKKV